MEAGQQNIKVFLVCTGLGNISRGYESFTRECFDAISGAQALDLYLLKGAGEKRKRELVIRNFKRTRLVAKILGKLIRKDAYYIEQISFCLGMLPALLKFKPSVIYFSDFSLGTFLWHLRRLLGLKYKLLFSNGAPNGPPFSRVDHVQQLLPFYIRDAVKWGESETKQTLLPYAVQVNPEQSKQKLQAQSALRDKLKLPNNRKVILSVGAVNSYHKRMDYLITEYANMPNAGYYLVILGQVDEKSQPIISMAEELLPSNSYVIKQVRHDEVMDYLLAADYFILASFKEGLPRVLIEALSVGLIPIVHDYIVTRETLGDKGVFKDLSKPGALEEGIKDVRNLKLNRVEVIQYCWSEYSWDRLGPKYVNLIKRVTINT